MPEDIAVTDLVDLKSAILQPSTDSVQEPYILSGVTKCNSVVHHESFKIIYELHQ